VGQDCGASEGWLYLDHVVELRDGGARLDPRHVMFRCISCHTRKTPAEAARRQLRSPD
jgi:hypothetical protein